MERLEFGGLKPINTSTIEGNKNPFNFFAVAFVIIIVVLAIYHYYEQYIESKKASE